MEFSHGNIFSDIPERSPNEVFSDLASAPGIKIERIVSTGQATPAGEWLDQKRTEWVMLVSGSAAVLFEGEASARELKPGDYLLIPPHKRHRVEWTVRDNPTIWLAVHFEGKRNT
jgi:cupin 2 domain-containing protein